MTISKTIKSELKDHSPRPCKCGRPVPRLTDAEGEFSHQCQECGLKEVVDEVIDK
jgi:hypothetical protein